MPSRLKEAVSCCITLLALISFVALTHARPVTKELEKPEIPQPEKIPDEMTTPGDQPWFIRAIIVPKPKSMFIRLPIIDTDPNRGITYGVMPIWVINGDGRIKQIHAP